MKRFKNILVLSDDDDGSQALIDRAKWLAEANGAALTLFHVVDTAPGELSRILSGLFGSRATEIESEVLTFHQKRLDTLAQTLEAAGLSVKVHVAHGIGFIETIQYVLKHDCDLVLKSAEHAPLKQAMRGADLHLLRKCPCPVWVLNGVQEPAARRIVAAVDPEPNDPTRKALNRKVMELATSLARQDGAQLDVLNAWHLQEEATLRHSRIHATEEEIQVILSNVERQSASNLNQLVAEFEEYSDLMRVIHVKGIPEDVITEHAESEKADILVMGTIGRTGLTGLFIGNVAETVLNRVSCSVMAVKPEGFVSPVAAAEPS
ncbi:MAG: universal stress protein [Pseudomonadota bacterium]